MAADKIEFEEVDNLLFDPENPRLPEDLIGGSQRAIIEYIARHEAVEDLMAAIGRNGFFRGEPLVVYQAKGARGEKGKWRVIEGNRRLASVKLLQKPSLYSARTSLAKIAEDAPEKNKPTKLPVVRMDNREDALPYLGSRHIVGVKAWDPLPKARYMLQLFELTKRTRNAAQRYRDVASQIGSGNRSDYIRKNLNALAVFNVMKANSFYGDSQTDELNFSFGVLYSLLGDSKSISGFAGATDYDRDSDETIAQRDPIVDASVLHRKNISQLYDWCFRVRDDGTTILGESRNIRKLGAVVRSPEALKVLRATKNLDLAYGRSEGVSDEVVSYLSLALENLRQANAVISNSKIDSLIRDLGKKTLQQALAIKAQIERTDAAGGG